MVIISHYQVLKKDKVPRYEGIVVYRSTEGNTVEGTVGEVKEYLEDVTYKIVSSLSDQEMAPFVLKLRELACQIAADNNRVGDNIRGIPHNTPLSDKAKKGFAELRDIKEQVLPSTRL